MSDGRLTGVGQAFDGVKRFEDTEECGNLSFQEYYFLRMPRLFLPKGRHTAIILTKLKSNQLFLYKISTTTKFSSQKEVKY